MIAKKSAIAWRSKEVQPHWRSRYIWDDFKRNSRTQADAVDLNTTCGSSSNCIVYLLTQSAYWSAGQLIHQRQAFNEGEWGIVWVAVCAHKTIWIVDFYTCTYIVNAKISMRVFIPLHAFLLSPKYDPFLHLPLCVHEKGQFLAILLLTNLHFEIACLHNTDIFDARFSRCFWRNNRIFLPKVDCAAWDKYQDS